MLVFAASLAAPAPQVLGAPPRIEAAGAFGTPLVQGRWQPLLVTLTNGPDGDALRGEVQVVLEEPQMGGGRLATYTRPVSLARGANQTQATVYVKIPGNMQPDMTIYVVSGDTGEVVARRTSERIVSLPEAVSLVAVSAAPEALAYLNGRPLGVARRGGVLRPAFEQGPRPGIPPPPQFRDDPAVQVAALATAANLPDRSLGYDATSIVYLGDLPPDAFSDAQVRALRGWVAGGGLLVVGGPRFAADERFRPWLPARWAPSEIGGPDLLAARYKTPPSRVPLFPLTGTPQAQPLLGKGWQSLALSGRVGRGTVVALGFDAAASDFAGWPGAERLWRDVAARGITGPSVARSLEGDDTNWGTQFWFNRSVLRAPGLQAPSFSAIGMFLLSYLLLLVPINYAILKRLDRREWTWLTVPVLVAVFSVGAYGFGYAIKGGRMLLNTAAIVEMGPLADGSGSITAVAGLFSPRRHAYDVSLADGDAVLYAPDAFDRTPNDNGPLTVAQTDSGTQARKADISMWAMRVFGVRSSSSGSSASAGRVGLGAGLRVTLRARGALVTGAVQNRTGRVLNDVVVSLPGNTQNLGTLRPDEEKPVRLPFAARLAAGSRNAALFAGFNQGMTFRGGEDRTTQGIRSDIQQAIQNAMNNPAGGFNAAAPGLPAARVNLELRNETLRAALDQLQRRAGLRNGDHYLVDKDVPLDKRITLRIRNQSLEEALNAITRAAGVRWRHEERNFRMVFHIGKTLPPAQKRENLPAAVPALVTAWNYEPLLPLRVDGRAVAEGSHVNLLAVHATAAATAAAP